MNNSLTSLHPNPGWASTSSAQPVGKHCILELYNCDPGKLNDEAFIRTTIATAARDAGTTVLHLISHHFQPQGVTGLVLLAESHLSIHTWPESGYAAVDVFTCGDHTMPERACHALIQTLEAEQHSLHSFLRETPPNLSEQARDPLAT